MCTHAAHDGRTGTVYVPRDVYGCENNDVYLSQRIVVALRGKCPMATKAQNAQVWLYVCVFVCMCACVSASVSSNWVCHGYVWKCSQNAGAEAIVIAHNHTNLSPLRMQSTGFEDTILHIPAAMVSYGDGLALMQLQTGRRVV